MTVYISDEHGNFRTTSVRFLPGTLAPSIFRRKMTALCAVIVRVGAGETNRDAKTENAAHVGNFPTLLATYQLRQLEYLLRISRDDLAARLAQPARVDPAQCGRDGQRAGRYDPPAVGPCGARACLADRARFQVRALRHPHRGAARLAPLLDGATIRLVRDAVTAAESQPPDIDLSSRAARSRRSLGMTLGQVIPLPLLLKMACWGSSISSAEFSIFAV